MSRTVGAEIRYRRKRRSMTLQALADAAGLDIAELSKIERDKRGIDDRHIHAVATALKTTASRLLHDTVPRPEHPPADKPRRRAS